LRCCPRPVDDRINKSSSSFSSWKSRDDETNLSYMSGKHADRMTVHVCDRSQSSPKPPSLTHCRTIASMSSCGSATSDAQGIVCEVFVGSRHVAKLPSIVECVVVERELMGTLSHQAAAGCDWVAP
jgi:hypothetical protein